MSVSAKVRKNMLLVGVQFNQSSTPSGDGMIIQDVSVPVGNQGDLTTRTDHNTGVVTLDDSGHYIETWDIVDLYWSGGCRTSMMVTNVTGATITLDEGSGDILPAEGVAVILSLRTELDVEVLGTNVAAIFLYASKLGNFFFMESATLRWQKELGEGKAFAWEEGDGVANPITGHSISSVGVSHGDAAAATMRVGIVYNN